MKYFIINNKYKVQANDLKEAKKKYLDWKESQVKIEDVDFLGVVVEDAYPDVVTEFQRKTGMTLTNFNEYPPDDWRADFKHPKPIGNSYLIALLEPISGKRVAMEIWFSDNRYSHKQINGTVSKCISEAKYMYEDELSTFKLLNMAGKKTISEAELKRRLESILKDSIVEVKDFIKDSKVSDSTWVCKNWPKDKEDRRQLDNKLRSLNLYKNLINGDRDAEIKGSRAQIEKFMTWMGIYSNRFSEVKDFTNGNSIKDDESYKGYQIGKTNYGWIVKKNGKKVVETETDSEARRYIDKLVEKG